MSGAFAGKVVLVTGGASGIGRATVQRFLDLDASVVIADVQNGLASEQAAAAGDRAHAVACDVSDPGQMESAVTAAVERFGGLDVLVGNAGIEVVGSLLDTSTETMSRVFAVNVLGALHGIKYAAPRIAERGGGAIVCTSSIAGLGGGAMFGAYAATKAAVISLIKTAALELAPMGIRVNCVCPGIVETPMLGRLKADLEQAAGLDLETLILARQRRWGSPEDIARAIAYLASEAAEFVSGVALPVDNALSSSVL
jgi:NAD(P)-dependent dehydrogenase (short-subunit alcohol dehydrogenase family)